VRMACLGLALAAALAAPAAAQDVVLTVPDGLRDSGLWNYLLPRFKLKTQLAVALGPDGALELEPDGPGTPAFSDGETTYTLSAPRTPAAARFADWLTSEVGRRTVESFTPQAGGRTFAAAEAAAAEPVAAVYEGDAAQGERLSYRLCGRCHVVGPDNRMKGIGSTPSFAVLRAMPGWAARFEGFFALNPHGAFTRIEGVTPEFPIDRPPPIAPVEMTLDDLDAILAFVAQMAPADLGAPISHQ